MSTVQLLCCLMATSISIINGQTYILMVPDTIDAGEDVDIYVQMLNPVSYETIEGRLQDMDNKTFATGTLALNAGKQDGVLSIKMPKKLPDDIYNTKVVITGSGVVSFTNETIVHVTRSVRQPDEDIKIFIQTDKAVYKTGQKVLYRVFSVDGGLKPINDTYKITIVDARNVRIEERRGVGGIMGDSGELQLSDQPNLGTWRIQVVSETDPMREERLTFQVLEYVLPKFEVRVKLPSEALTDVPELKGHVTAKYTNGKPVEGIVVLTIKRYYDWYFYDPRGIQKQFKIDGEADFVIPTDALRRFDPHLEYDTLIVEANVTETLTGISDIGSKTVQFHKDSWMVEFFDGSPSNFKPGFKYTTYLKVSHPDGRPVAGTGERVKIGLTYYTDKPSTTRSYYVPPSIATSALMTFISPFPGGKVIFQPDLVLPVPRNGIIKLTLDIPREAATGRIDVEFKDKKVTKNLQRFRTLNEAYLTLDMKDAKLKVGEKAEFILTSNILPRSKITYHIVQNKKVLGTHFTRIGSPYRPHTVYETITKDMAPSAQLVAYFVHKDGEIIADAIEFSVDINFQNYVELKFDQTQVEPGSNVSLKIKADPESVVNVLAVDKSVMLLKSGNDITKGSVRNKLTYRHRNDWIYQGKALPRSISRYGSTDDSADVFKDVGLEVLTDATLYDFSLYKLKSGIEARSGALDDITEHLPGHGHGHWHGSAGMGSAYFSKAPDTRVRKDFPETWIWTNLTVGDNGSVDISGIVPDSITTWQATAFALNEETGLGIADVPANLTVYMPFYITIQVPFSVVNGEIAVIQAVVFNYYPYDMYVTVTLMASNEDFIGTTVKYYGREEIDDKGNMTRCILVKSNDAASAYFNIRPVRNGVMNLEVHATSPRGNDAVIRSIIVKPQGQPAEKNMPSLITMQPGKQFIKEIPIEYPSNVVAESQRIRVMVTGDLFGPSMDNLDALLVTPWGSGEQNMVRFAPAIYAATYLQAAGNQDEELHEEIKDVLTSGYQRQMRYQHYSGAFSAFGRNDSHPSLWLTAFVLKSFAQASDYIYVDSEVMKKAALFILGKQDQDGSFSSSGRVYMHSLQGSSASSKRALTAYCLIALKEVLDREVDSSIGLNLTDATQRASNYLNQELSRMTDDYELAITAYALALMKSPTARNVLARLTSSSRIVSSTEMNEDWKYWKDSDKAKEIEINSYVLLAYSEYQDTNSGLPILKWLIRQRNPHGGFVSTQDTVIALQALAKFATLTVSADVSMTISIETPTKKLPPFVLNADNKDIVQFIDVPGLHENVKITAAGIGTGLVEVASFYNYFGDMSKQDDIIQVALNTNGSDVNQFEMEICVRVKTPEDTGMLLIDIGAPSGYTLQGRFQFPYDLTNVKHKEKSGERLHIYVERLSQDATCLKASAQRETIVGKVRPASVRVYSYYHPDNIITKWYLPEVLRNKSLCDVCGVECGCKFDPNKVPQERCKSGSLIPVMPSSSEYKGTTTWRRLAGTRGLGQPSTGTTWTRTTRVGGQPGPPMGTSWSRRTHTKLGKPVIHLPPGSSWRRETRISGQPNIPVGSSWSRSTRIRAQPNVPVGTSWRKETRVRGMPTMPVGGSWHPRKTTHVAGQPVVTDTWQSRRVVRKPAPSSWQSSQNVWGMSSAHPSNVVASRSRSVNIG